MKIYPPEKIELKTELPIQEVRQILRKNIQPKQVWIFGNYWSKDHKLYEGFFEQDKFELQLIKNKRNSFLPRLIGTIQTDSNGTKLIANLKLRISVGIFMLFWFGIVSAFIVLIILGILNQGTNPLVLAAPLIMIAFGFGMILYGYAKGTENSINSLKKILSRQIA